MATAQPKKSADHRQTRYAQAPPLDPSVVLPQPEVTNDLEQAKEDLLEYGMCLLGDALSPEEVDLLRTKLDAQAAAERDLGDLTPASAKTTKQSVSNMPNKGKEFLELVERRSADELGTMLLGKDFLISSITGMVFHGPTDEPQMLHRDQGQVPATAGFPAVVNMFWLLDDVTPERGGTCVIPGSHRWPAEHQVTPPTPELASQISAPAGSLFAFDGRMWHGTGINREGHPRRNITTLLCLPWMRQQENWGVSCLQEVLDEASDKLKVRLGLKTYGTLGGVNGTATDQVKSGLGNGHVVFPEFIIGENAKLHRLKRVTRED
ncbi:MAG: phytanoyl-CoA dioxygenase family protein [Candidatus Hydrogenedentota bacterium]